MEYRPIAFSPGRRHNHKSIHWIQETRSLRTLSQGPERKIKTVKVYKNGEVTFVKAKDHWSGCTRILRLYFYSVCPAPRIVQGCPCQILFQGKCHCSGEDHHRHKSKQICSKLCGSYISWSWYYIFHNSRTAVLVQNLVGKNMAHPIKALDNAGTLVCTILAIIPVSREALTFGKQ